MKRTLVISEEHRIWRGTTSTGLEVVGRTPTIVFTNLLVAAGAAWEDEETMAQLAGNRLGVFFELIFPPREENRDQPASTVR